MLSHAYDDRSVLETSERVNWKLEGLPESLAGLRAAGASLTTSAFMGRAM